MKIGFANTLKKSPSICRICHKGFSFLLAFLDLFEGRFWLC
jgi:hypothetical protein